jgi:hypothetical protein
MRLHDYMTFNNVFHINNAQLMLVVYHKRRPSTMICVKSILLQTKFDLTSFEELVCSVLYAN